MRRALFMVVAMIGMLIPNAKADFDLQFSFSSGAGTVTGEIFGLTDNVLSSASKVLITSIPAAFAPLAEPDATKWSTQLLNAFDFDFTNGVCTICTFQALESFPPTGPALFIGLTDATFWSGVPLTGPITFTPIPEPSTWVLLVSVMLALAIVHNKRMQGRPRDPATRMKS